MSKSNNWDEEKFIEAVKNNISVSGVLKSLGILATGGNYSTFKKYVRKLNIDTSHFKGMAWSKGTIGVSKGGYKPPPLEEVLIQNSDYSRQSLKKRLIKDKHLENKCSICHQEPIWQNKPLVMILDHINGISDDNRLENLRLLCPHCNSQTDTFAGRNIKTRRREKLYCLDCNKKLWNDSVTRKCANCLNRKIDSCSNEQKPNWRNEPKISQRRVERPSKEELQEMVNTMPMTTIAKKYNVSDNAIRKWCKSYEISWKSWYNKEVKN